MQRRPLVGRLFYGNERLCGEGQPNKPFEIFVIILATDVAFVLIELFHDELDVMEAFEGDFGTRL